MSAPSHTITLIRSDGGAERIVVGPSSEGEEMSATRIGDRPSLRLLNRLDDGVWIQVDQSFYRNDLGIWNLGLLVADPAHRYNAVQPEHIVETHLRSPVFLLESV